MKSFKQFIIEAKQVGTLYHYTSPVGAGKILDSNKFECRNEQRVSFTRDKNFHKKSEKVPDDFYASHKGAKQMRNEVPTDVSFEIDGNKISHNHKITPYNWKKDSAFTVSHTFGNGRFDEMEETVKGDVNNAKKFIKKIRIHSPISDEHLGALQKHGIPIEHTYK